MRKILLALIGALIFGAGAAFAADPEIGTWTLNEGKSKLPVGTGKNKKVVYEMAGDQVKITVEGVDAAGKATHAEWLGKYDGKDYPFAGDAGSEMQLKKLNDRTFALTLKKDGKVVSDGGIVISADGRSRTVTTEVTDKEGKKAKRVAVYDKSS